MLKTQIRSLKISAKSEKIERDKMGKWTYLDLVDMVGGGVQLFAIEEEEVRQKCVLGWILKGKLECWHCKKMCKF